jgi:hypothetical protein
VNQPGLEEQPRVLLVSVPYAMKAGDAETLGGKPLSAFVLAPSEDSSAKESLPQASASDSLPLAASTTQDRIAKFVDGAGTVCRKKWASNTHIVQPCRMTWRISRPVCAPLLGNG